MRLVHDNTYTFDIINVVLFLRSIETQYVGKSGTPAAFYADAQPVIVRNVFTVANLIELVDSILRQSDRSGHYRLIEHHFHV